MDHDPEGRPHVAGAELLDRLDKMVDAGRMTAADADRLRAASDAGELDHAMQEIRVKHAKARVEGAVDGGRLTRDEADAILARLDGGEDPRFVLQLRLQSRPAAGGG